MQKLVIPLRLSKRFILLQMILLCSSLMLLLYFPWPLILKLILSLSLLSYSARILIHQQRWQALIHSSVGWQLGYGTAMLTAELRGDSTITNWVTILRFNILPERQVYSCVIFDDTLENKAQYRQLIMRLRTGSQKY